MRVTRLIPLLAALAAIGIATSPQGPQTTVVYYAPELATRAAEIVLSPRYTTLIQVWDSVEDVYFGDKDLFDLKTRDNILVLWPKQRSGSTDLVVFVDGRTLKFEVSVSEEKRQPREYIIKPNLPYALKRKQPVAQVAQRAVQTPTPSPRAPEQKVPVKASKQGEATFHGLRIEGTSKLIAPSQATVIVSVTNHSLSPVRFDPSKVEVRQNGKLLEYMLVRTPPVEEIPPTRGLTLTFSVNDLKAAPLTVGFELIDTKNRLPYWVEVETFPTEEMRPVQRISVALR